MSLIRPTPGLPASFAGHVFEVELRRATALGRAEGEVVSSDVIDGPVAGRPLFLSVPSRQGDFMGLLTARVRKLHSGIGDPPARAVLTVRFRRGT